MCGKFLGANVLKLKRRAESEERQTSAREEVVSDGRDTSAPPEEEFWIDDHFQQTLKTLIRKFVEAENELYALQERIKRLKDSKSEGKVPTGLVVHRINAKGRNSQVLQNRFDAILRDAELKLLDTTIEALTEDEQQYKERCATEKENVTATMPGCLRCRARCLEEFVSSQRSHSEHRRRSICRFGKKFRERLLLSVRGDKDL